MEQHGGYLEYHRWCKSVFTCCRELIEKYPIMGLHHVTLGSFRLLPRYDLLGIPYSLGPLGGGEYTPGWLLSDAGFPRKTALLEAMRPLVNRMCAIRPAVRCVLKKARRLVATTNETADLLRLGGGSDVMVRFPDVFESPHDSARITALRTKQCAELAKEVSLIWSGRGLWWKGGQIAIRFLQHLRERGVTARLHIYSEGPSIPSLREKVRSAALDGWVVFNSLVPRLELLQIYERMHLFVYPAMHDSSSSAIPEAYSFGLPSMTLGVGGVAVAADPAAGLNRSFPRLDDWISAGVAMLQAWQSNPQLWLAASYAIYTFQSQDKRLMIDVPKPTAVWWNRL